MKEVDVVYSSDKIGFTVYVNGSVLFSRGGYGKLSVKEVMGASGIYNYKGCIGGKEFYKQHKVTPKHVANLVNSWVFASTVGAIPKELKELCFDRTKLNSQKTFNVSKNIELLEQALKDGNKNITPFIARFGLNTKQLKSNFGNNGWKEICKNSFTRNKLLADTWLPTDRDPFKQILKNNQTKSVVLKKVQNSHRLEAITWLMNSSGLTYAKLFNEGNRKDSESNINLYQDTKGMALTLGQPFNENWSQRKMKEKHDDFSKIYRDRLIKAKLEKEQKLQGVLREGMVNTFELEGVKAVLCDTYSSIVEEGSKMHHCVAYFADSCYDGEYLVFHLSGDGEETTLGVLVNKKFTYDEFESKLESPDLISVTFSYPKTTNKKEYRMSQHYGVSNALVKSEKHKKLANLIIESLNKEEENV